MMTMFWAQATTEQYEALRNAVKWEQDVPKGAILHASSFDDDGLHVTDIWETPEDFNNFVKIIKLTPKVTGF